MHWRFRGVDGGKEQAAFFCLAAWCGLGNTRYIFLLWKLLNFYLASSSSNLPNRQSYCPREEIRQSWKSRLSLEQCHKRGYML
jgi:hypothetical protein